MSNDLELEMEQAKFDLTWSQVKTAYPDGYHGAVDRHRNGKRIASGVSTAASLAVTGAQYGTGSSALALGGAIATGAAVSATGVGLVAAAGVLTIGSIVSNAVSLGKTIGHCENLKGIQLRYTDRQPGMAKDHDWIGDQILLYISNQKNEKVIKKGIGTAGLGALTTVYSIGRSVYKSLVSTKGVKRNFYAHVLARHLITHECPLAQDIVSELLSPQEMAILKGQNSDVVGAAIKDKMKSV